jgi:hypothetical protein
MRWLLVLSLAACSSAKNGSAHDMAMTSSDMAMLSMNDLSLIDGIVQGTTRTDVYITWYGFNDNSCQIETQHDCNTIAFPKSDGWSVPHDIATEGAGTYDDPNTFATAALDDGSMAEIAVGQKIYVPSVRKYFVMEDQCAECGTDWTTNMSWHVDLWMGPSYGSNDAALTACEDKLTIGATGAGTGTIIIDPSPSLPVDMTPLFGGDTCTAHQY